jgi:uncharacterized membrane protein (DUF373 family)
VPFAGPIGDNYVASGKIDYFNRRVSIHKSTQGLVASELLTILVVIAALSMAYLQYQKIQRSSPTQSIQPSLRHG